MRKIIDDVWEVNGKIRVRLAGAIVGSYLAYDYPIDAMLAHVMRELEIDGRGSIKLVLALLGIDPAVVTRCRQGVAKINDNHIVRMHELSGIPVAELRWVGCMEPSVARHVNARVNNF